MRFLICDIRRLFSKKATVALCILSPVLGMFLFASIIAPMMFTGKGLHFNLAVYDEDKSPEVRIFITQLIHSEALAELVSLNPVNSLESGIDLLKKQEVSVLVHIPPNLIEDLKNKRPVTVSIIGMRAHALEQSLIIMSLGQSLRLVGEGYNQLETARFAVLDKGVAPEAVGLFMRDATLDVVKQFMGRRQILGESGTLSPLGEYLPVEYYLAAIFVLFAAFAMLPLIHFTAADLGGAVFRRGLACGHSTARFFLSRVGSGTLFILLVLLMLFPATLMLNQSDKLLGSAYNGSLPALLCTILLTALCFSGLAAGLAAWIGKAQPALWIGFYLVLGMAVAGGVLIPEGLLQDWLAAAGRWLPMRTAMRSLANALFSFETTLYRQDMIKLAAVTAVILPLGFWGVARRERGT